MSSNNSSTEEKKSTVKVLGSNFEIDSRYQVIDAVGSGAYGVVVSATDTKSKDPNNG